MAAPKTVKTYDLNGTLKDFPITFEYLARKFVTVTLIGTDRRELVLNTDYRFSTPTQITTMRSSGWGPGDGYDLIEIRRLTSATDRLVDFADGSILRAFDLNTSQIQSLHIAEEARDLTADTIGVNDEGNLDARAKRIVNVADPVDDGDVVTLRYEKDWAASTLGNKTASEAARDASVAAKDLAVTSKNLAQAAATTSTEKAVLSAEEAEKSRLQAVIATNAVGSIGSSVADAENYASASNTAKIGSEAARDASVAAKDASVAAKVLAQAAAVTADSAGLQMGMSMWGHRPQPFKGFAVDDGQELSRATYPDFAAMLDSGLLPTVTEAVWQADVTKRGCFVALSSTGKFRMRDLNGISAGSLGANFLRGGNDAATVLKRDQMQNITGTFNQSSSNAGGLNSNPTGVFVDTALADGNGRAGGSVVNNFTTSLDASRVARTGSETFPTHATGAWMTRLYGLITPLGSAEASSLATAYASLATRATTLEGRAGIIEAKALSWESPWVDPVAYAVLTYTHGLGAIPLRFAAVAKCKISEGGYSVGDLIAYPFGLQYPGAAQPWGTTVFQMTTTSLKLYTGLFYTVYLPNKATPSTMFTPANANWQIKVKAYAD